MKAVLPLASLMVSLFVAPAPADDDAGRVPWDAEASLAESLIRLRNVKHQSARLSRHIESNREDTLTELKSLIGKYRRDFASRARRAEFTAAHGGAETGASSRPASPVAEANLRNHLDTFLVVDPLDGTNAVPVARPAATNTSPPGANTTAVSMDDLGKLLQGIATDLQRAGEIIGQLEGN